MTTDYCDHGKHKHCPVIVKPFRVEHNRVVYLEVQHCACPCHETPHGSQMAVPRLS